MTAVTRTQEPLPVLNLHGPQAAISRKQEPLPAMALHGPNAPGDPSTIVGAGGSRTSTASAGIVTKFKMIGMDKNISGTYDTWIVTGTADITGVNYSGGLATPLRDIHIASTWTI